MILTSCESPLGKTIEGQLASMLASRCIQYEGNVKRDVLSRVAKNTDSQQRRLDLPQWLM